MSVPILLRRLREVLRRDAVLCISLVLAVVSAFFVPPCCDYLGYIDLRTLCLLWSLMLVVAGWQDCGAFDWLTACFLRHIRTQRALAALLVGLCFFASMLITNDVALITFVPLAVTLLEKAGCRERMIPLIVLQTIAANLGSMLTPLGNPQNLYLHSLSGMSAGEFLSVMALPTALSALILAAAVLCFPARPLAVGECKSPVAQGRYITVWSLLFLLCLLAVLRVLPCGAVLAAVVAVTAVAAPRLLKKADYGLLLTFVFFFIFIGNIKAIPALSQALCALVDGRELTLGILASQVISNVPAAMLLAGFTTRYDALLLGVNLGGLGTLIASMASVISYKLYAKTEQAKTGRYLLVFTAMNAAALALLWTAVAILR